MTQLFPYQEEGVKFLASRRRALLLDDTGLGKTLQAIRASDLIDAEHINTICPASVRTQWRHAYADNTKNKREFSSVSYEFARANDMGTGPVLCLDEAHALKNPSSKRTKRIFGSKMYGTDGVINGFSYVWGLTATPMPRDASDLYAPLYALAPECLKLSNGRVMDYWQYVKHFCKTRPGYGGRTEIYGSKNLDELKERMAPYYLRRTKEQVFSQWKEPVISELWLQDNNAMAKLENSPDGALMKEAFTIGGLEAIMGLSDSVATIRRLMGLLVVAPLVEWLIERLDGNEDKIVVVCYHREVIAKMKEALEQEGFGCAVYQGGMTDEQKAAAISDFKHNNGCRIFLLQINAGGTGVDGLQHMTGTMVYAEFSWIDDDNKQVLGRVDRIGQKNPVLAYFVGIEGSLHGNIMQAARRRAADNKTLFN